MKTFLVGLYFAVCASVALAATSVSQRAFTWTFDQDYTVGQFVNGDWYVVEKTPGGGVTVTAISPADPDPLDATDLHCSAVNIMPSPKTRYKTPLESRATGNYVFYQPELNVAKKLPLKIAANSSLLSVKSSPGTAQNTEKNWFDDAAVLTVLPTVPPAGSFRPPYCGTDKTIRGNINNLDTTFLRNLTPVGGEPDLPTLYTSMEGVLIDLVPQWPNTNFKSSTAGPSYGRDISKVAADAVLSLHLNYSAAIKKEILIRVIQRGIDVFGAAKGGMYWAPNGGHNSGRKLFMVTAAKALRDTEMQAMCNGTNNLIFQEDCQHWYITQTDVDTPRFSTTSLPFTTEMIGMPEWASNPISEAHKTGSQWNTNGYRFVNGSTNTGVVLAAELSGMRTLWAWDPLFDYIENRYYPLEGPTPTTGVVIVAWHEKMWVNYFKLIRSVTAPKLPTIKVQVL